MASRGTGCLSEAMAALRIASTKVCKPLPRPLFYVEEEADPVTAFTSEQDIYSLNGHRDSFT
jgi:hypothetical protein